MNSALGIWMTSSLFSECLIEFDLEMTKNQRKIALLLDNAPFHKISASLSNVELIFIPPNLTCHLQPLESRIIYYFKASYHQKIINYAIE